MKLLKFYADWCGPCKALSMVIESAKDRIDIPIEEINIETDMDSAVKYGIRSVPVMILVDESGNEIKRKVGSLNENELFQFLG
jgi:thioredoxin 1